MADIKRKKYKTRRRARLAGQPMLSRDQMPWWYESTLKDFRAREKEQAAAARRGPLSTDPMVPWGNERPRRRLEAAVSTET